MRLADSSVCARCDARTISARLRLFSTLLRSLAARNAAVVCSRSPSLPTALSRACAGAATSSSAAPSGAALSANGPAGLAGSRSAPAPVLPGVLRRQNMMQHEVLHERLAACLPVHIAYLLKSDMRFVTVQAECARL